MTSVLSVINRIIQDDAKVQEHLSFLGFIPTIIKVRHTNNILGLFQITPRASPLSAIKLPVLWKTRVTTRVTHDETHPNPSYPCVSRYLLSPSLSGNALAVCGQQPARCRDPHP
jgi:hypothetical protein